MARRTLGRVPRLSLRVKHDGSVVVSASKHFSDQDVLDWVSKKADWIYKHLNRMSQYKEKDVPLRYEHGETHRYLGKRYVLNVMEDAQCLPKVHLKQGKLSVTVRKQSAEKVKKLLHEWYKERALEVFSRRLTEVLPKVPWVSKLPVFRIVAMKSRWGSCSSQNRITLNLHLIKAPQECIDYVWLHELCHIAEHNHSQRFYDLMDQVMPDWRVVKMRLQELERLLLK